MHCRQRLSRLISKELAGIHAVWTLKMFAGDPQIYTYDRRISQVNLLQLKYARKTNFTPLLKASLGSWKAWEARCSEEGGS